MKIQSGDTIQIFLTVDGVPYAKTCDLVRDYETYVNGNFSRAALGVIGQQLTRALVYDIETDEQEAQDER